MLWNETRILWKTFAPIISPVRTCKLWYITLKRRLPKYLLTQIILTARKLAPLSWTIFTANCKLPKYLLTLLIVRSQKYATFSWTIFTANCKLLKYLLTPIIVGAQKYAPLSCLHHHKQNYKSGLHAVSYVKLTMLVYIFKDCLM